jgi:tRNA 2-thiouridine synthesizing protein B
MSMAMLHIVNKSPTDRNSLGACLRLAQEGSSVLMIEDGVYAAMQGGASADAVASANGLKFYVLGEDLNARGMSESKVIDGVQVVDYAGFVDLVAGHDNLQSWL